MTNQEKTILADLLDRYYEELTKTCEYNCNYCNYGVMQDYSGDCTCAIDVAYKIVANDVEPEDNFVEKQFMNYFIKDLVNKGIIKG
mgnify:CR=1 FL=1